MRRFCRLVRGLITWEDNSMTTPNRLSGMQHSHWLSALLFEVVFLFAVTAQAEQHITLTSHVPEAVANAQAPQVG